MAIKGTRATQIANDTNVSPVKFNFKPYDAEHSPFYNNPENIDFVTWEDNLYVTVNDMDGNGIPYVEGDPAQHGFLLLVAKGKDGAIGATGEQGPAGHAPRITAKFEGNQVTIYADGTRIAATNDLTPPSWRPELVNHTIVWNKTKDDTVPQPIDLDSLRTSERPVIFRVDSDNTKRDDEESGPAKFIQWKYEGDEDWRNLISIDELMNVALAGISFWTDDEDGGAWHFGHREVVSATYDVKEEGGRSIAKVELGDILFDAGRIPFANYELEFGELENRIVALEQALREPTDLSPYYDVFATKDWTNLNFTSKDEFTAWKERVNQDYAKKTDLPSTSTFLTRDAAQSLYQPLDNYALKSELPDTSNFLTINDLPLDSDAIKDIGFEVVGNTFKYHVQKNNTWGNWLSIPISTLLDDNCIKNVSYDDNNHRLEFTWEDNQTVRIDLSNLIGTPGVDETKVSQMIAAALQNLPSGGSTITVSPTLNSGTEIGRITVDGNTTVLYAPTGSNGTISGIKLNANTSVLPIQNGIVTLNVADNPLVAVTINNGALYKKSYNDSDFVKVADLPSGGTSSDWTEQQIRNLITNQLTGYATEQWVQQWVQNYTYDKQTIDNKIAAGPGGSGGTSENIHTFTLYQRNNIEDDGVHRPTVPSTTDFSWDGRSMILTDTHANTNPSLWLNSPENQNTTNGKIYLWVTMATYSSIHGISSEGWSNPVCLTAKDGSDGVDGAYQEFVYIRTEGEVPYLNQDIGLYPNGIMADQVTVLYAKTTNRNVKDFLPSDNEDGMFDSDLLTHRLIPQWTDNPVGVDDEFTCEWVAIRKISYDANNNPIYGLFSDPVIWSMWGEDGMDGDGVEYIYLVTPENTTPGEYYSIDPSTHRYELTNGGGTIWPPTTSQETNSISNYQTPDWYPGNGQTGGWDRNWTDNPLGVSADNPYEWVSVRKKVNEVWQPFSTPALWARFGKDGADGSAGATGSYRNYIFTRTSLRNFQNAVLSNDTVLANIVTTLNNQVVDVVWHDTIPDGNLPVWMSWNTIGDNPDQGWTSPQQIGDSSRIQVEFSSYENAPTQHTLPNLNNYIDENPLNIEGVRETIDNRSYINQNNPNHPHGFRDDAGGIGQGYDNNANCYYWGDENEVNLPIWMATAVRNGGEWSGWTYAKIKGETGPQGLDGHSFTTRTSFVVNDTNYNLCSGPGSLGALLGSVNSPQVGDAVMVQRENAGGTVYSTEIWAYTGEHSNEQPKYCNIQDGLIDGWRRSGILTAGSSYIHQKFAYESENQTIGYYSGNSGDQFRAQVPTSEGNKWLQLTDTNVTFTERGEAPGKYIGMYTDNVEADSAEITDYTWAKWSGDDGFGMEQIFILSATKPATPVLTNGAGTIYCSKITFSDETFTSSNLGMYYYEYDSVPTITDRTGSNTVVYEWKDRPQEPTPTQSCWISVRKLDKASLREWTEPVEWDWYSVDGMDGNFEEYIYHLYNEPLTAAQLNSNNSSYVIGSYGKTSTSNTVTNDKNQPDFLPADSQSSSPTTFWTDNPTGIDANHKYEYASKRRITHTRNNDGSVTTNYEDFCQPFVWSKWGEKGRDGDGVEYIFCIVPANITSESNGVISLDFQFWPDNSWTYDTPGTVTKTVNGSSVSVTWTDDPGTPTAATPYQFVSVRKYKYNSTTNASAWDNWSEPSLWTRYTTGGTPGENAITADLTNEMDAFCVSPSSYTATRQYSFGTSFSLFDGQTELTSITAQVKTGTNTYSSSGSFLNNKVSVTMGIISGANRPKADIVVSQGADFTNYMASGYEITFKVSKGSIEREVIYKLVPIPLESGSSWKIIPSANHVSVSYDSSNNPTYLPNQLTCTAYRSYMDGETSVLDLISTFDSVNGPYNITYETTNLSGVTANPVNYSAAVSVANATYAFITFKLYYKLSSGFVLVDQETVPINRDGLNGTNIITYQSLEQPVMRITDWTGTGALTRYFNGSVIVDDNNTQAANNTPGVKYLDVVKYVVTESGVDSIYYYKCKVSVDYGDTSIFPSGKTNHSPELDTSYWEMFTAANDTAMANLIVHNTAFINSLTSHQVVVTDNNNIIQGGLVSSNSTVPNKTVGDIRFWAGTPVGSNLLTAPFTVDYNGKVVSRGTIGNTDDEWMTILDHGYFGISFRENPEINDGVWHKKVDFGYLNGDIVLNFYDDNGNVLYNLGPSGIFNVSQSVMAEMNTTSLYQLSAIPNTSTSVNIADEITAYQYIDGYRMIGNLIEFISPFDGRTGSATHSVVHLHYFSRNVNFRNMQMSYSQFYISPTNPTWYIDKGELWSKWVSSNGDMETDGYVADVYEADAIQIQDGGVVQSIPIRATKTTDSNHNVSWTVYRR